MSQITALLDEGTEDRAEPRRVRHGRRRRAGFFSRLVGFIGELLITAGVLLGLFVIWQVFWTDVEAGREQRAAVEDFLGDFADEQVQPGEGPPPVTERVGDGEVFGTIYVPRWGEDYAVPVREGTGLHEVLNTGSAGHYPETQMPGELGNVGLAAHRQSYGAAFRHVDSLEDGDRIILQTRQAWYVYEVYDDYIVTPDQVEVVAPVPGDPEAEADRHLITLTTCHPLWSTAERWITHGEFLEWYPPSREMPEHLWEVS